MRNIDILASTGALQHLSTIKLPFKAAAFLAVNTKAVREYIPIYQEQRTKVLEQFAERDADGKMVHVQIPKMVPAPVLGADGLAEIDPATKAPKTTQVQAKDADGKLLTMDDPQRVKIREDAIAEFNKTLEELDNTDVTEAIRICKIKVRDFGDVEIEPAHIEAITWMIAITD